jgi:hypothetical protein
MISPVVSRLAVVSLHTSPLTQPGQGDSGGMNVYVRELSGAIARQGIDVDIYVRRDRVDLPPKIEVEPTEEAAAPITATSGKRKRAAGQKDLESRNSHNLPTPHRLIAALFRSRFRAYPPHMGRTTCLCTRY